ncbi:MAG: hypothetical protein Q7T55_20440 [Solirubrobacteraceae bacterium]|nr:hypothetical protein [Solirubrobacteraceae bacterium]
MQMTLATPAADAIELVLAAWSEAAPAQCPVEAAVDAERHADGLVAQLSLRLDDTQIPLWDARADAAR